MPMRVSGSGVERQVIGGRSNQSEDSCRKFSGRAGYSLGVICDRWATELGAPSSRALPAPFRSLSSVFCAAGLVLRQRRA